ncbi:hypothetical protein BDV26DRAFT_276782 [Aspergillus bertholletiae]|uniref:Uncharacterized protein n=1 Tax=Aspergillus bertholletiae TaxID=1226010 RepID=A0A5N7AMK2_9EURO|nr:hypothetical protein BDV26DRAFT_276782 [Aspergillus bertholletiae]
MSLSMHASPKHCIFDDRVAMADIPCISDATTNCGNRGPTSACLTASDTCRASTAWGLSRRKWYR